MINFTGKVASRLGLSFSLVSNQFVQIDGAGFEPG